MDDEALEFFAQVDKELWRLGVTREQESADPFKFAMPAAEYLAVLQALPDNAGWAAVKARLNALVPPHFQDGWKAKMESGDQGV